MNREVVVSYLQDQGESGATIRDISESLSLERKEVREHLGYLAKFDLIDSKDSDKFGTEFVWSIHAPERSSSSGGSLQVDPIPTSLCPACGLSSYSREFDPVEGDQGEYYCSIDCLNKNYSGDHR